jgi:DNA-binding NtrC family response regulator
MGEKALLIAENDPEAREIFLENNPKNGFWIQWVNRGEEALRWLDQRPFDMVITEVELEDISGLQLLGQVKQRFPETPVVVMSAQGSIPQAIEAIKQGALDYIVKPLSGFWLEERIGRVDPKRTGLFGEPEAPSGKGPVSRPIVTQNRKMLDLLELCRKVAASKATVLVQGESGTGKELFARYLYERSPRNKEAFVAVNCASLPDGLLESELFGHEKGAFTGAIQRKLGKFELAQRGTILLDEISEMNTQLQAKLLRVLQENELDRIGGRHPVPLDIRVIATTNQNLEQSIDQGDFRADLYYRLNVIPLRIPPLRERPEDIELLVAFFVRKFAKLYSREVVRVADQALNWIKHREWRGNVRELENLLERTVLVASGPTIEMKDFCLEDSAPPATEVRIDGSPTFSLREVEKDLIFKALDKTEGNRTQSANILGISVRTLRNKLQEYKQETGPWAEEGSVPIQPSTMVWDLQKG